MKKIYPNISAASGSSVISRGSTRLSKIVNERYVNIVTDVGLSVSILFLIVHLITFFAVDDLRNLAGKNLASFCAALLLEYSSTLLSTLLEGKACLVNEIAAYYFIMASAFWMLIMSYDVWQTVRCSYHREVRPPIAVNGGTTADNRGKKNKRFLLYSACSWLTPAVLTFLVFSVLPGTVPGFRLDFDETGCFFRETDIMYIFVETVFGTILFLNTSFFASSVWKIYATQSAVKRSRQRQSNAAFANHFRLYGRLSLIMGVTWAAEFVIYFCNFDILSTTFRIINTFEGLLIMMAFTCRKEVFDRIKSFSLPWSEDSLQLLPFYGYVSLRRL